MEAMTAGEKIWKHAELGKASCPSSLVLGTCFPGEISNLGLSTPPLVLSLFSESRLQDISGNSGSGLARHSLSCSAHHKAWRTWPKALAPIMKPLIFGDFFCCKKEHPKGDKKVKYFLIAILKLSGFWNHGHIMITSGPCIYKKNTIKCVCGRGGIPSGKWRQINTDLGWFFPRMVVFPCLCYFTRTQLASQCVCLYR